MGKNPILAIMLAFIGLTGMTPNDLNQKANAADIVYVSGYYPYYTTSTSYSLWASTWYNTGTVTESFNDRYGTTWTISAGTWQTKPGYTYIGRTWVSSAWTYQELCGQTVWDIDVIDGVSYWIGSHTCLCGRRYTCKIRR